MTISCALTHSDVRNDVSITGTVILKGRVIEHNLTKGSVFPGRGDAGPTGPRWTDFAIQSLFAFLTAKQCAAVSALDGREVGLRVSWQFYVLALWLMGRGNLAFYMPA